MFASQKELLTRLQVPWASLKLGRVIGKGGFGVVYQGKWQVRVPAARDTMAKRACKVSL